MDEWQYLMLLGGCVLLTLPLELVLGVRVYRSPRRLVLSLLPMLIVFGCWDVLGILRHHWWYEPRFISGVRIGPMPVEELLFFLVVPICGLLTYESVGRVKELARSSGSLEFRWPAGLTRTEESRRA